METDFLQGIFKDFPFLIFIGPLVGLLMSYIKTIGKITGWSLLAVSGAISTITIYAYGYANNWADAEWRKVPFAIIVTIALSNLASTTALHAKESLTKNKH